MDWYRTSIADMLAFYPAHFTAFNAIIAFNAVLSVILSSMTISIMISVRDRVLKAYRIVLVNLIVWCVLFNIPGPLLFHPVMILPTMAYGAEQFSFEGMLLYNVHSTFASKSTTVVMILLICTSVFASFIATVLSFLYYYQLLTGLPNSFFLSRKGSASFITIQLVTVFFVVGIVIATAQFYDDYPNAVLLFSFSTAGSLAVVVLTLLVYMVLCALMAAGLVRVFQSYRRLQRQGDNVILLRAHRSVFRVLTANFLVLVFFEVFLPISLGIVAMLTSSSSLRFICSFGMAFSVSIVPSCACIIILIIVKPYRIAVKKLSRRITCNSESYGTTNSTMWLSRTL
ncbi:hypothetical protein V3C99_013192 [Haemonchus contortus]